jgi:hypothetical protein
VRLTQLHNRLWRAARVIIDVGLHTGTMTFEEGVNLLVEKVRLNATPRSWKWGSTRAAPRRCSAISSA